MPKTNNEMSNKDIILIFLAKLLRARGDGVFSICDLEARVPEYARSRFGHSVACGTIRRKLYQMIEDGTLGKVTSERPPGKPHKVYTHQLEYSELITSVGR